MQTFRQLEGESLYEAWERYKAMIRKCPSDMFADWGSKRPGRGVESRATAVRRAELGRRWGSHCRRILIVPAVRRTRPFSHRPAPPPLLSEQPSSPLFYCFGPSLPLLGISPIWSEGKGRGSGRREWFCDFRDHCRSSGMSLCCQKCLGCHRVPPPLINRSFWPPPELLPGPVQNRSYFVLLFRAVYAAAKMCGVVH
nr:uncharacterized protein LOC112735189 [Arachis hypogaea]